MFKPGDFILSSYCFAARGIWHICYILPFSKNTYDFTIETISFLNKKHFEEYQYWIGNSRWGSYKHESKEINFTDTDFFHCMQDHTFLHPNYEEEFKEFLRNKLYNEFGRPPDLAATSEEGIVDSISQEHLLNIVKPEVCQVDTITIPDDRSVPWVNLKTLFPEAI